MMEQLLPIGSVVKIKQTEKRLMITGVLVHDKDNPEVSRDYIAVAYPQGYMMDFSNLGFNHGDIEEVVFRGFEDEEREEFIAAIEAVFNPDVLLDNDNKDNDANAYDSGREI